MRFRVWTPVSQWEAVELTGLTLDEAVSELGRLYHPQPPGVVGPGGADVFESGREPDGGVSPAE